MIQQNNSFRCLVEVDNYYRSIVLVCKEMSELSNATSVKKISNLKHNLEEARKERNRIIEDVLF